MDECKPLSTGFHPSLRANAKDPSTANGRQSGRPPGAPSERAGGGAPRRRPVTAAAALGRGGVRPTGAFAAASSDADGRRLAALGVGACTRPLFSST